MCCRPQGRKESDTTERLNRAVGRDVCGSGWFTFERNKTAVKGQPCKPESASSDLKELLASAEALGHTLPLPGQSPHREPERARPSDL